MHWGIETCRRFFLDTVKYKIYCAFVGLCCKCTINCHITFCVPVIFVSLRNWNYLGDREPYAAHGLTLVSSDVEPVRKVWKPRIQIFVQRDLLCFFTAAFCILLVHTLSSDQVNYGEEQKKVKAMLSVYLNTRSAPRNLAGAGTLWTCIWKVPD